MEDERKLIRLVKFSLAFYSSLANCCPFLYTRISITVSDFFSIEIMTFYNQNNMKIEALCFVYYDCYKTIKTTRLEHKVFMYPNSLLDYPQ